MEADPRSTHSREQYRHYDHEHRLIPMPVQTVGWQTLLGMGVAVAAQLGIFLVLGLVIDSAAGTAPVFLLIGVLLGVVSAITFAVVKFRQLLSSQSTSSTTTTPPKP